MEQYNEKLSYKIVDNGYEIYLEGELWITQYDEYSKVYDKEGSFEDNCMMQLKELEEAFNASIEEPALEELQ